MTISPVEQLQRHGEGAHLLAQGLEGGYPGGFTDSRAIEAAHHGIDVCDAQTDEASRQRLRCAHARHVESVRACMHRRLPS